MMTPATLPSRVQKYILLHRAYRDMLELCGSQSPVLNALAREQDILWAGMTQEERTKFMAYKACAMIG